MKTYLRVLVPLLVFSCASLAADLQTYNVRVQRVLDGDTGVFVITEGRFRNTVLKVRLAGVDAPEMKVNRAAPGQSFALDAKMHFDQLVDDRVVKLTVTAQDDKAGVTYGVLHYWIGDRKHVINAELVRSGFAEKYDATLSAIPDDARISIETAQAEAQDAKKGIWSLAKRESPADYRKRLASD
jgi:endonuclease YncB( thermonuclease family)